MIAFSVTVKIPAHLSWPLASAPSGKIMCEILKMGSASIDKGRPQLHKLSNWSKAGLHGVCVGVCEWWWCREMWRGGTGGGSGGGRGGGVCDGVRVWRWGGFVVSMEPILSTILWEFGSNDEIKWGHGHMWRNGQE